MDGLSLRKRLGLADLPDDILAEILSHYLSLVQESIGASLEIPHIRNIQGLSLVCKSFARVIQSTPSFWTTIVCGADPHILEAHLRRAGTFRPLRFLRSDISRRPLATHSLSLILSQLPRIEELKIPITRSSTLLLSEKLRGAVPLLKALEVYVSDGRAHLPPLLHGSSIFQGERPCLLASLKLSGVRIPWTSPLIASTLTNLSLHSQPQFQLYTQFQQTFIALQNLEELSLDNCLPAETTDVGEMLRLPSLRKLVIVDDLPSITGVLAFLEASLEHLIIQGPATEYDLPPFLHACTRLLNQYLPSTHTPLYLSELLLNRDDSTLQFQCVASSREDPLLRRPIFEAKLSIETGSSLFAPVARTIMGLPLEEVEGLTLFHVPSNPLPFWLTSVALRMPSLRTLVFQQSASIAFLDIYMMYLNGLFQTNNAIEYFAHLNTIKSIRFVDGDTSLPEQIRADEEESNNFSGVWCGRIHRRLPEIRLSQDEDFEYYL
ncbi:hypothetical protein ONZ45_g3877 [Pleurotus djamor]|nr:hypothetical protein ONZ45_g3877 [Pleurotus djamor]